MLLLLSARGLANDRSLRLLFQVDFVTIIICRITAHNLFNGVLVVIARSRRRLKSSANSVELRRTTYCPLINMIILGGGGRCDKRISSVFSIYCRYGIAHNRCMCTRPC